MELTTKQEDDMLELEREEHYAKVMEEYNTQKEEGGIIDGE